MSDKLEVITRGVDSSGRPLRATRQAFELYDRCNDLPAIGGLLVIVQGQMNKGVTDSAGTHDLTGSIDYRTWNLTAAQISVAGRFHRDHGGAWWTRTAAEGFDPHAHMVVLSDTPLHPATANQRSAYIAGRNGLASGAPDTFPYRPSPLVLVYDYQGDDMALSDQEQKQLAGAAQRTGHIEAMLERFIPAEVKRDAAARQAERQRHEQVMNRLAGQVDVLGEVERELLRGFEQLSEQDKETRQAVVKRVRATRRDLLVELRDDPATDGTKDNPSEDGLREAEEAAKR